MLIQDRIQLIIKANNLTASEFANAIGVKRSNLSHVLSGRNKPGLDFLEKVINTYPNVNASWLITGETREGTFTKEDTMLVQETEEVTKIVSEEEIERIVVFYKNGTFSTYQPSEQ